MRGTKYVMLTLVISTLIGSGCGLGEKSNADTILPTVSSKTDTAVKSEKVSMVISNIPFPTSILDTLHFVHAKYLSTLPSSVDNVSLYSQNNTQAINLGVFGADLSYVISFEQFQRVGVYMKATKFLADKTGVPMAFTEDVIERCQKNSNNKDSLTQIVYGSYSLIDKTLKNDKRKSTEVLVLAGGWVEGLYLTTQSMQGLTTITDRQGGYSIILDQGKYLDILLNQLDLISDSPYCQSISTGLHEIRGIYNSITSKTINEDVVKSLAEKVSALRERITKGGNV